MAIQPLYLIATNNLGKFLGAVRNAQAPDKVGLKFVEDLGFTSTNDRLFVRLLKALKFIDDTGKPTARYHSFLDETQWKRVLADGIRDDYPELFRINRNANTFSREQLTGKLKSLGEGKLSEAVLGNTIKTFSELVKLADFSGQGNERPDVAPEMPPSSSSEAPQAEVSAGAMLPNTAGTFSGLVYRIEIVLPATRDQAIYDAIFRSLRAHLYGR